ncbi:neural cell adhesion molecule L1.1 [Chanos chanos]|uniref:Neural cell adhesion molecule L1 n=1 Tax=Chanos chanos TaxID=29144 RepID=A0A6J2UX35_CHACN|nr:neural cell adhesion molecule L1.1-like [Chanos chanos]
MPPVHFQHSGCRGQHGPPSLPFLFIPLFLSSFIAGPALGAIHIPDKLLQPPVITAKPVSYTAFSLDDVFLPCEATGDPTPSFRWEKDGILFGKEEMVETGTITADGSPPLEDYQGQYRCYASNELGTAMSDIIHLITEPTPTLPKGKRQRKTKKEGDSIVLHCDPPKSSVPPHIHWMDSQLLHIAQSDRVTTGLDGNLYFANLLPSDSRDDYTCNAQYISARTILPKEPISLNVETTNSVVRNKRPHLLRPTGTHSSYLALRGQNLTLECIPSGLPTPTVMWRRKDSSLPIDRITMVNFHRRLTIGPIAEEDDGEYECVANNSQGSVTHTYTITVEAAPYWSKEPKSQLYAPGETVKLDCQAEGIPKPSVTWSMNGQPISDIDVERRRTISDGTLILRDAKYGDTAVYQCQASNKHGTILVNTYIHVIELPPQILTEDGRPYRVIEGKEALMECSTFGSPTPKVKWVSSKMEHVLSDPRISQMVSGSLHVINVTREDSALYTCSVLNSNLSIEAVLTVLNKTVIVSPPQTIAVRPGTEAILNCVAVVDPEIKTPMIQWKINDHKIMPSAHDDKYTVDDDGSLKITNINYKDEGRYMCEVMTELDMATLISTVTVIDKPDPPHSLQLLEPGRRSVTLSWTPGNDHNSPVSVYVIEMREEQHSDKPTWEDFERVSEDVNQVEVQLHPYCMYRFRVSAINSIGRSDPSLPSESYSTPAAAPDQNPEDVQSNSTDPDSMIITWKELERHQFNGPGFKYRVSWRQAAGKGPRWDEAYVSHPPFIVNNTDTYTPFEIKVQAVNEIGDAPIPSPKIGHSGEDFPVDAPSGVQVTMFNKTSTAVIVRWEPVSPESVRGALRGYKIHLRKKGPRGHKNQRKRALRKMENEEEKRVVTVNNSQKTEEVVTGLDYYSNYELSVTAFNKKGEGPHSKTQNFSTPEGAPGPPIFLGYDSPSDTELILRWQSPKNPNGVLTGYLLRYQEKGEHSSAQVETIDDPTITSFELTDLNPQSTYLFYLIARTNAGDGEPVEWEGATLLDGEPPTAINTTVGETFVNLSWVPGERLRNLGFKISYIRKSADGEWEESEQVNSTQTFYQLQGLQPGTQYHLKILHSNLTYWEKEIQTHGLVVSEVKNGFATQGWFIGLISAVVLLLLVLLILCFIKRSKGGKYSVKDKEEGQVDSEARPMKDEAFGEYRLVKNTDNDEKRSVSQPSICADSKMGSDDSLADYGEGVDIQYNEDGSFIGQYSGRRDTHGHEGHESSGATSPVNHLPPTSISFTNSVMGILDRGN